MFTALFSAVAMPLGKIFLEMFIKMIGYKFITEAAVISARAWAQSTETKNDDMIVASWANAIGVPPEKLKELEQQASAVSQ
jgi:hypothetical protein